MTDFPKPSDEAARRFSGDVWCNFCGGPHAPSVCPTHPSSSETASVQPLPCPFCGSEPRVEFVYGIADVRCVNEKCPIRPYRFRHDQENLDIVFAEWNRRSPSPAPIDAQQRIAEIRERLAKATPGPWRVATDADAVLDGHVPGNILCPNDPDSGRVLEMRVLAQPNHHFDAGDDVALIANAPADLAFLLSLVAARSSSPSSGIATNEPMGDGIECVDCEALIDAFTGRGKTPDGTTPERQRALHRDWPELSAAISSTLDAYRSRNSAPLPSSGDAPATPEDTTSLRVDYERFQRSTAKELADRDAALIGLQAEIARLQAALVEIADHPLPSPPDDWDAQTKERHWTMFATGSRELARRAIDASRSHSETPNG